MRLVVMKGSTRGRVFNIEEGNNLIGRWDPDSASFPEIDLDEDDVEAKVSRKHAVIERKGDVVTVEDLDSRNGTYLNREMKLEKGLPVPLKPGDELIVGKTVLLFEKD